MMLALDWIFKMPDQTPQRETARAKTTEQRRESVNIILGDGSVVYANPANDDGWVFPPPTVRQEFFKEAANDD